MNPTAVAQGKQAANAAFNPTDQLIAAQNPAIANLYNALVQGLQGQNMMQQQSVMQGAQRAGVNAPSLQGQVATLLSSALAPGMAQLGVTNAQSQADIGLQRGKNQVNRANAATTLASNTQDMQIAAQKNQLALQDINRQNEVAQIAEQTRQARAAARAAKSLTDMSETAITKQLRLGLNSVVGSDGHVSPDNLAKAYAIWQSAGLAPDKFWSNFQGLWNPNQGDYNDQFYYSVNKFQKG